jgi:hypothetical protein
MKANITPWNENWLLNVWCFTHQPTNAIRSHFHAYATHVKEHEVCHWWITLNILLPWVRQMHKAVIAQSTKTKSPKHNAWKADRTMCHQDRHKAQRTTKHKAKWPQRTLHHKAKSTETTKHEKHIKHIKHKKHRKYNAQCKTSINHIKWQRKKIAKNKEGNTKST